MKNQKLKKHSCRGFSARHFDVAQVWWSEMGTSEKHFLLKCQRLIAVWVKSPTKCCKAPWADGYSDMWRGVNFTERRAWFVNLWSSTKRNLSSEICVTRELFSIISWKPQGSPETSHKRRDTWGLFFWSWDVWNGVLK